MDSRQPVNSVALNLIDTPVEILQRFCLALSIEWILSLSVTSKEMFSTINDHVFQIIFNIHFPHKTIELNQKNYVNWFLEKKRMTEAEYQTQDLFQIDYFSKHLISLFEWTKQGDVERIQDNIKSYHLNDMLKYDMSHNSVFDWAYKKNRQDILDIFYKKAIGDHSPENKIDYKINLVEGVSIVDFLILCHQPVKEIGSSIDKMEQSSELINMLLMVAATCGHLSAVTFLIEIKKANVNYVYRNIKKDKKSLLIGRDSTPIIAAARKGHLNILEYLIKQDANFKYQLNRDSQYEDGYEIVLAAVVRGQINILKYLNEARKIDLKKIIKNGEKGALLYYASKNGYQEVVKYLLEQGADINEKFSCGWAPIHAAAQFNQFGTVKYLAEKGAFLNTECNINRTPLLEAIRLCHSEIAGFLIKKDTRVCTHEEILATACAAGDLATIKLLKLNGARFKSHHLWIVLKKNTRFHHKIAKWLIDSGVDLDQQNVEKSSVLDMAIDNDYHQVIPSLIKRNVNIHIINKNSTLPFFEAVKKGRVEICKHLAEAGADVNEIFQGKTPLMLAIENDHIRIMEFLIEEKGLDVNQNFNNYTSPLILAVSHGHFESTQYLFLRGARIDVENNEGLTPAKIAGKSKNESIAKFFELLENLSVKNNETLKKIIEEKFFNDSYCSRNRNVENINRIMLFVLWTRYYLLENEKSEKAKAIRGLIYLILKDYNKIFIEHVEEWKNTNLEVVQSHDNVVSRSGYLISNGVGSLIGIFSPSLEKSIKEIFIEDTNTLGFINMLCNIVDKSFMNKHTAKMSNVHRKL